MRQDTLSNIIASFPESMSSKVDEGWGEEGVMQIEGFILVSVQTLGSNCEAENLPLTVQDKERQTLRERC